MADNHRSVTLARTAPGVFTATNVRGGEITVAGGGSTTDFSPVELLLTAIGACSGLDVDALTSRRAEPEAFEIVVEADKERDADGNFLKDIQMTVRVRFGSGEGADQAREVLPEAVRKSHDRWCTVSRTVERGTPIGVTVG